ARGHRLPSRPTAAAGATISLHQPLLPADDAGWGSAAAQVRPAPARLRLVAGGAVRGGRGRAGGSSPGRGRACVDGGDPELPPAAVAREPDRSPGSRGPWGRERDPAWVALAAALAGRGHQ